MKRGTKRSPISKEVLIREQQLAQRRAFIIEKFYPALKEATVSIDEAQQLLNAAASLIMEEVMQTMREVKMREISKRIIKKLSPDGERLLQIEGLIHLFDNVTLFEARGDFESLKALIEQMKTDEMRNRHLDSMNPEWDRYLNK